MKSKLTPVSEKQRRRVGFTYERATRFSRRVCISHFGEDAFLQCCSQEGYGFACSEEWRDDPWPMIHVTGRRRRAIGAEAVLARQRCNRGKS